MDLTVHRLALRNLLILEVVLFSIGGIFVANLDPLWMHQLVWLLFLAVIVTSLVYYVTIVRSRY
ncbi:MAG: hypothetical protein ACE5H4_01180 [Candidatus Thorarchaeota archaeon]